MKRIICFFKGHQRGETGIWTPMRTGQYEAHLKCSRCGYMAWYPCRGRRLVSEELRLGFDGK